MPSERGRGVTAVTDMKARIAAYRRRGYSAARIVEILWERSRKAELGEGYRYEFALAQRAVPLRQTRDGGQ